MNSVAAVKQKKTPALSVKTQQGAVLLVSLILLLVMTIIGITNMRSSSLQFQMSVNNQERSKAFNAAEFVLERVQNQIQTEAALHEPIAHLQRCEGAGPCYDSSCSGGYCFEGTYKYGDTPPECVLTPSSEGPIWSRSRGEIWREGASARYRDDIEVTDSNILPKYIVEFLCYVDKNVDANNEALCDVFAPDNCLPYYRITVLAESGKTNANVMLQATTKAPPVMN